MNPAGRWLGRGVGLLLALLTVPLLLSGLDWPLRVGLWLLLVLLADEASGWLGYLALALGATVWALPLLGLPVSPELLADWAVLFPLAFTGFFALLLVKHAGGRALAPLGWPLLIAPFLLIAVAGRFLDDDLALPADPRFLVFLLGAAALAYAVSLGLGALGRRQHAAVPHSARA